MSIAEWIQCCIIAKIPIVDTKLFKTFHRSHELENMHCNLMNHAMVRSDMLLRGLDNFTLYSLPLYNFITLITLTEVY